MVIRTHNHLFYNLNYQQVWKNVQIGPQICYLILIKSNTYKTIESVTLMFFRLKVRYESFLLIGLKKVN